jgi:multidrug efflux pump subunit AcrA (membrane-fusion protein)
MEVLEEAVADLGVAIEGGDLIAIGAAADAVEAALDALDALGELDTAGFRAALVALGAAVEGEDPTEIDAAYAALEAALADLVAQAAATTTTTAAPAATTTTAAPAGGVATGAGGTADTNAFPMSVFAGVGLAGLLLAGLYTLRRRSEG